MKFFNFLLVAIFGLILLSCAPDNNETVYPKATHLYFSDYPAKRVGVMDLNATNLYDVVADENDGLDTVTGIAVDFIAGKIYAVEELKNRVVRFNADGSGSLEVLFDAADSVLMPTALALDVEDNIIYWANSGTGQIKTGSMDGGVASSLKYSSVDTILSYCYGLAIDKEAKLIFYSDLDEFAGISMANLAGGGFVSRLFTRTSASGTVLRNPSSICLDLDSKLIYWADEGLNTISVGSYGGSARVLYDDEDGLGRADGVAIDKGSQKIYWSETNEGSKKIVRANLDGTGELETVLSGVESYSLVLKFANQ